MKKNKFFKKLLVGAVTATMVAGLFSSVAMAATPTQEQTLEYLAESSEISLESIAALNECEVADLNTVYDDDGYLTFIGNQISTDKITNEEEAQAFIEEKLSDLLQLDKGEIELSYYSDDTSPNTDIDYYRFSQVVTTTSESTGQKVPIKYLARSLKLGVDKDGYPILISADLSHEKLSFDISNIRTKEEAIEIAKKNYPSANIYSDYTTLGVWSDKSGFDSVGADSMLVWMVYADNTPSDDASETEEIEKAPYLVYIVNADKTVKTEVFGNMASYSLEEYSGSVSNPSLHFFKNMEDAGEYTYTVDLDWVSETDKSYTLDYVGGNEIKVTVPVMYNEKDGYYYLGEEEHNISMSNYYDFDNAKGNLEKLNPYVTKTPDDPDSWHFKYNGKSTVGGDGYFDDPDYVLASFSKYVEIVNAFGEKMSMFSSYPDTSYLLCTYQYASNKYPSDANGFIYNAANGGVNYGWTVFATSPACALCLDTNTMCHEFTHGVNNLFAAAKYQNEQGAVMESFADMVGIQMGFQIDGEKGMWTIGGAYTRVFRSIADPITHNQPKYKNGVYYVNSVDNTLLDCSLNDYGGVHTNSGVPNYLGYLFVNGTPENSDEATISTGEGLNLWFETLYLSTSSTDFVDLGAYLEYAANVTGCSTEQKNYMNRLIKELGFEDGQVDPTLLNAESRKEITVNLDFEDDQVKQDYYFCSCFYTKTAQHRGGGFENNTTQKYAAAATDDFIGIALSYKTADSNTAIAMARLKGTEDNLSYHVKKIDSASGSTITLGQNENICSVQVPEGLTFNAATEESNASVTVDAAGNYLVCTKTAESIEGEYNLYIIKGFDKAVPTISVNKTQKTYTCSKALKYSHSFSLKASVDSKGTLSYKVTKGNAKSRKYLSLNESTGKITIAKGTPKGTYKLRIKIHARATETYTAVNKRVTITVTVK